MAWMRLEYETTDSQRVHDSAQSAMQNGPKCTAKWAVSRCESAYKKCLREERGKFTGYQLLSSFWLKVARTDEDGNTTR